MKNKEIRIFTIVFLLLSFLGSYLTFFTFSNVSIFNLVNSRFDSTPISTDEIISCSPSEGITDLSQAGDPNLNALSKYQKVCNSFVSNRLMIFTEIPSSLESSNRLADQVFEKLKSFSEYNIEPVVIAEPVDNSNLLNYDNLKNGDYDSSIDGFFSILKEKGLTDKEMGTWVPFPESNVPYWNHGESLPGDFAILVNNYLSSLKKYFPDSSGSVLLNSITYDPEDTLWENGDYISLIPYTNGLNPDLVDSLGIQGFPWVSRATDRRVEQFNATDFLSIRFAVEAAKLLRTKDIWVNTGTFGLKYTNNETDLVSVGADQRKSILEDILVELLKVQDDGYRVWVNIFAQDKSITREATDWSYTKSEGEKIIFQEFVSQLLASDIEIGIYDRTN